MELVGGWPSAAAGRLKNLVVSLGLAETVFRALLLEGARQSCMALMLPGQCVSERYPAQVFLELVQPIRVPTGDG